MRQSIRYAIQTFPDIFDERLMQRWNDAAPEERDEIAHVTVTVDESARIGNVRRLGKMTSIGAGSVICDGADLGVNVNVGDYSVIGKDVVITDDLALEHGRGLFSDGSSVEPLERGHRPHIYARKLASGVAIGPNVVLPSEVQLGHYAVIPTSDSVAQIGRFGESQRFVTVYGTDEGPFFGVGCQFGINSKTFLERVSNSIGTSPDSSLDYAYNMPAIQGVALRVQAAYEREAGLVDELCAMRDELVFRA